MPPQPVPIQAKPQTAASFEQMMGQFEQAALEKKVDEEHYPQEDDYGEYGNEQQADLLNNPMI
jgi:hypothetical protein